MAEGLDDTGFEDCQFLTGSPQRFAVLAQLRERPARPTDLCDTVDATRTTIQRILAGCTERQWVVKRDGEYQLTVTGQRVFDQYNTLLSEIDQARTVGPLAAHLGAIAADLPPELLDPECLTTSSEQNPLAAIDRFTDWLHEVNGDVRAISPIVTSVFNDAAVELLETGTHIEFIIDHSVLERSASDFSDALDRGLEHENIDTYVHDTTLDIGLALDRSRVCLAAYDDRNNLRAIAESDATAVYHWAETVFDRYRERSQPLAAVLSVQEKN
ncbi:unknown [Haloarcula marismortui ATCC 43049]|uniref:MarR family transcriptional regulator n=1 Tax=Haloarcula marismortui (strain ATCC 43049 / DSM 3752 / JCM 8966 / VKM B-1809) TaxID=272569 RepID=Q5V0Z2_HALMA|nr:MarR family transcriptional regulator [Haloarcula marismortui]AAV46811.1 unknown [Haloarcula marismortui ATCC 43049]QCP91520.1 MarR family transcriptional regulator [Haloarcula marismortui ATCC 43049]